MSVNTSGASNASLDFSTILIHGDGKFRAGPDVAPALHVATTFENGDTLNERFAIAKGWLARSEKSSEFTTSRELQDRQLIYSRDETTNRRRVEEILGAIEGGHAVTYSSGLSAIYAALIRYQPRRIFVEKGGYKGSHSVIDLYCKTSGCAKVSLEVAGLESTTNGDLIWLESPLNPTGDIADIAYYVNLRAPGAKVIVDCTFSPPPLQQCMKSFDVDMIMHSSTKFYGGHSDLLGGILICRSPEEQKHLLVERTVLGSVMGSMETWLLLRSLRTLELRVTKQSQTATKLVGWLWAGRSDPSRKTLFNSIDTIFHASIPTTRGYQLAIDLQQLHSPVFTLQFRNHHLARLFCKNLKLFVSATSLGGCESLVDWRVIHDMSCDPRWVRCSIGLENADDLQKDIEDCLVMITALEKTNVINAVYME